MEEIIQQDQNALFYLNGLGNPYFDQFWTMVSEKWIWIPLYIIFLYVLYKNFKLRNLIFILIFIALGLTISDQLASIFKNGIMRLRPCKDPQILNKIRVVICGGPYGFYSGHASNSFFIATYLSFLLKNKIKWLPFLLFFWASIVAYSRIYLGVHYPFDVIFGCFVGFLLGGLFANLTFKVLKRDVKK